MGIVSASRCRLALLCYLHRPLSTMFRIFLANLCENGDVDMGLEVFRDSLKLKKVPDFCTMILLLEGLAKKSKMLEVKAVVDQVKKWFPENLVGGWKKVEEEFGSIVDVEVSDKLEERAAVSLNARLVHRGDQSFRLGIRTKLWVQVPRQTLGFGVFDAQLDFIRSHDSIHHAKTSRVACELRQRRSSAISFQQALEHHHLLVLLRAHVDLAAAFSAGSSAARRRCGSHPGQEVEQGAQAEHRTRPAAEQQQRQRQRHREHQQPGGGVQLSGALHWRFHMGGGGVETRLG
ncbi:PPR repeat [Musa troglodytarum]|uniref:PPR repeat n=1 Tax=Musa troglodytarum TaxID=320322 RepID=A0A9E7G4E6_9LILI|nr:PPR repeat [Musa troglodytarum]